jgi:predicted AAA+ superfamily ATPase
LDNGIAQAVSHSFSEDYGRNLENLVYLHLRRRGGELYYFKGKKECDFVVRDRNQITHLIQVCYEFSLDNREREVNGLLEAMSYFELNNGTIVTCDQLDEFLIQGKQIKVIPAYQYFIQNS